MEVRPTRGGGRLRYFRTAQIENQNDCCWSIPEYDKLWDMQPQELDPQKRKDIAYKTQELFYQKSPYIVLTYPKLLESVEHVTLGGLAAHPAAERRRGLHHG